MKKILLGIGGFASILFIGLLIFFFRPASPEIPPPSESTVNEPLPGYTIENVEFIDEEKTPDPNRGIRFDESLPLEAEEMIRVRAEEIAKRLSEDPLQGGDWLELALLYHTASDFEGAREVWEFLVRVAPEETVAYDNLGKLYHYQLKDYARAEFFFLESLRANPNSLTPYIELHSLYRYSYKTDSTRAVDILKDAMQVFPNDLGLWIRLGGYYRDEGNSANARIVFEEGLEKARELNDVNMVSAFGEEIARLLQVPQE